MKRIEKPLQLPNAYMQRAKILLAIVRDHIATLIVVINHVKSPNTLENAAVTRLENHKELLNKLVKSPEYIHQDPIAPLDLIWTTDKLCVSAAITLLRGNALINSNKTIKKYTTSLLKQNPSLIDKIRKKKAYRISPLVLEWDEIITTGKSLQNIHETMFFLLENIDLKSPQYHKPVAPASLLPSEAPQEA